MGRLPLFPLGTVLAPGRRLPLRVFEQRYVALVRDLLAQADGGGGEFGVVALRRGRETGAGPVEMYDVGSRARILHLARLGDDSFQLLVQGVARFRVDELVDAGTPYLVADVTDLREAAGGDPATAARLARQVSQWVERYRDRLGLELPAPVPSAPDELSYWLVEGLVLDTGEQQRLLAAGDTCDRLRLARGLLRREVGLIETLGAVPQRFDGSGIVPN